MIENSRAFQTNLPNENLLQKIIFDKKSAHISFADLHLSLANPVTSKINISFKKQPLPMELEKKYYFAGIIFDKETSKMTDIASKAESLRKLPEKQRLGEVLNLLGNNLHYPYNEIVEKIGKNNSNLEQWITENIKKSKVVSISDVLENGYGVCRHLAVTYLYLAQKAGLKGTLMASNANTMTNITRTDNGEGLFKMTGVGTLIPTAHAWNEIQLSDDSWIPIDPTTKLIGDSEEGLQMFKDANYTCPASFGYYTLWNPFSEVNLKFELPTFKPAESIAKGDFWLSLASIEPRLIFSKDGARENPSTNAPFNGAAEIKLHTLQENSGILNLEILDIKPSTL